MTRHDRTARRLVVCRACKNDRAHILESQDNGQDAPILYAVCTSCGHEMLRATSEAVATA